MQKDLVCGMEVDEKNAPAKSEYKGKTYYFCAKGCKIAFDKNPEKYLKKDNNWFIRDKNELLETCTIECNIENAIECISKGFGVYEDHTDYETIIS